jgi:hypothetical protein
VVVIKNSRKEKETKKKSQGTIKKFNMESTLSADKNRLAGQQQQPKVELVEEDVSNSSSYERQCSPSGQQLQLLGAQHLEPSFQSVKATKSVLFDTRSTTHAHNKKVQSGKKKKFNL